VNQKQLGIAIVALSSSKLADNHYGLVIVIAKVVGVIPDQ